MAESWSNDKALKNAKLARIFTPTAPVKRLNLLRGRITQILDIQTAIYQPGQHVVLYGERGVGKTSLASLLEQLLAPEDGQFYKSVRVNCNTQDTYRSVWRKVFRELDIDAPDEWETTRPDPDQIRWHLQRLPHRYFIVLDEYDRMEDDEGLSLMSDTIKALSDHSIDTKLVIVGVADSIDQLIGEHESVQRAVAEINMPRLTEDETYSIIDEGLAEVDMTTSQPARVRIGRLSEGLPHYTHLLTLHAAQRCVMDDRSEISREDVEAAVEAAVEKHSLTREYQTAIQSPRRGNLFSRVLAACALAEKNRLGYFTPGSVQGPMSRIMGKPYEIASFAPHLKAFTEIDHGGVLKQEGVPRKFVYRFSNPLLQPFAILAALVEGAIPDDYAQELFS